jgi:pantetheine-phosphate adenylyltransferase
MTKVIYPGSFNPFTLAHLQIVEQASEMFDEVIVVVANNDAKQKTLCGLISLGNLRHLAIEKDIKEALTKSSYSRPECVKVVALEDGKLLTDFINENNVTTVIRGVRSGAEFDAESAYIDNLDAINAAEDYIINLVFLRTSLHSRHISSSAFKSVFACSGWTKSLNKYIPLNTANLIIEQNIDRFVRDLWYLSLKHFVPKVKNDGVLYKKMKEVYAANGGKYKQPKKKMPSLDALGRYHNESHLHDCLKKYYKLCVERDLEGFFDYSDILALFWHDYKYNPSSKLNEENAANSCREFLTEIGVDDYFIEEICNKILQTKLGTEVSNGSYVVDVDLSILAATPEEYKKYVNKIKKEYYYLDVAQFNKGRIQFLENMLKRPSIFTTWHFKDRYEKQARINMKAELYERTIGL